MKTICLTVALALLRSFACAQEESGSDWKIMPTISVTKVFSLGHRDGYYDIQPLMYPPIGSVGFSPIVNDVSATGISFSARFLHQDFEPFAFTLSAGANWYHRRESDLPIPLGSYRTLIPIDSLRMPIIVDPPGLQRGYAGWNDNTLMSFPVSLGAQVLFPYEKIDKLMFFAGVEGNLHFMSERGFTRRQVEAGFSAVGGIAIKMFEFGVRYSRFAGQNNIGVQAGIRFNQFEL
jgi:hypothetical protein